MAQLRTHYQHSARLRVNRAGPVGLQVPRRRTLRGTVTERGRSGEPTRAGRAGERAAAGGSAVYSIGHSRHPLERFLELLRLHGIDVVVDVRSAPYSRHAPHMSGRNLRGSLAAVGIRYLYLGGELGGRPEEDELYDPEGHVLYGRVASTRFFAAGLERLLDEAGRARVAIMCAEEDPAGCHRRLLVGRALAATRSPRPAAAGLPGRLRPRAYGARTVLVADARAPAASIVTVNRSGVPGRIRPRVYQEK